MSPLPSVPPSARIQAFIARWYSIPLLLAVYESLGHLGLVSQRLLPSLVTIGQQLWRFTANGVLIEHAATSLWRAMLGFALAIVVGALIGVAMARSRTAEAILEPIFTFGYPIPKIALYPAFILVLGLGTESKVALVFLECVYPITIHVSSGMRSVDRVLVWAARSMGATPLQVFWRVLVPAALPTVFIGLRIALPVALIVTIVTEIIGESRGLGYFVTYQTASFEYARALAALLVIGVVGFCLDRGLLAVRDRVVFWQRETTRVM